MIALLIILILLVLILLTRIGIDLDYAEGSFSLLLRLGPVPIRILPKSDKPAKKNRAKAKTKKADKGKKSKKKPDVRFILEIARMVFHALKRFRKGVYVDIFRLRFISASEDPYNTAMLCGYANAAVGILAPLARRAFRIRESRVEIGTDFDAVKPQIDGRLKITIRVWRVPHIALAFCLEFLRYRRKNAKSKTEKDNPSKTTAQPETANHAVAAGA